MKAALGHFAKRARQAAGVRGEPAVLLTSSAEMRRLNRDFRGKDRPTDVLSFPADPPLGGDIAISVEIARENGRRLRHGLLKELEVLVLHGMLHLAGHDHERDEGEMAALEARLKRKLGLADGLIERAHRPATARRKKAR